MNMRLVSGLAGRFVQQQLEQLAVLEPEQQQSDEREQQYRIPRGKPLKQDGPVTKSHVPNRPDSLGCQSSWDRAGLRDYPTVPRARPSKRAGKEEGLRRDE
jgi:hypothetical protein